MTTKELLDKYGFTRQYLNELRNGTKAIRNGKKYIIKPKLTEGVEYHWERGNIVWDEKAVAEYFENRKKLQNKQ